MECPGTRIQEFLGTVEDAQKFVKMKTPSNAFLSILNWKLAFCHRLLIDLIG